MISPGKESVINGPETNSDSLCINYTILHHHRSLSSSRLWSSKASLRKALYNIWNEKEETGWEPSIYALKLFIEFTIKCYYVVTYPTAVLSLFNKDNTLSYFFIGIFIGNWWRTRIFFSAFIAVIFRKSIFI